MLRKEILLATAADGPLVNHRLVATFPSNGDYFDDIGRHPLNEELRTFTDYVLEGETGVSTYPYGGSIGWYISPVDPTKVVTYSPDISKMPDYDPGYDYGRGKTPACFVEIFPNAEQPIAFAPANRSTRFEVHAETSSGKTVEVPLESCDIQLNLSDGLDITVYITDSQELFFEKVEPMFNSIGQIHDLCNVSAKTVDGVELIQDFYVFASLACFSWDTEVLMADGSIKLAKDIRVGDMVKVWDFDNGCYAETHLFWVKKSEVSPMYQRIVTNTGRVLKQINNHRMFSLTNNTFEQCQSILGHKVWTVDGEETVVSAEFVHEPIEYYNAVSHHHMNLICNGFLTSCRFNNLYPIKDMKFIKKERLVRRREEFNVPDSWFYGVRLSETTKTAEEVEEYVRTHEAVSA